jgi:hypothetical protein
MNEEMNGVENIPSSLSSCPAYRNLLPVISVSTPRLLRTLVFIGLVFLLANKSSSWLHIPIKYVILWNSVALVHFYLDGLFWAFRDPLVRYLMPESQTNSL